MRKALHPNYDRQITIAEYISTFGNDKRILKSSELARCPVCKQYLTTVAVSTVNSHGHFAHLRNSDFCPTKSSAANLYSGLIPRKPDLQNAKIIKALFITNWRKHFSLLNSIVIALSIDEFIEVITVANKERIWEYSKLEEYQLPYIFATLIDFPPYKSYKKNGNPVRQYWFRCWFSNTIQKYEDLWIHCNEPIKFWRAWYGPKYRKSKPKIDDLEHIQEYLISKDFLNKTETIPSFVQEKIDIWINRYLSIGH